PARPRHRSYSVIEAHLQRMAYGLSPASGLATSRATSMNSFAAGLSIRFFRGTTPIGTRATRSFTGKTLMSRRLVGKSKIDLEHIARSRPVDKRLIRTSAGAEDTVARG